jgi:arsenate reductase
MDNPPSDSELKGLVDMLGISPEMLVRKKEPLFEELFLHNKILTDSEWIELLCLYPNLLERPIVVKDGKAIIGRPPERVLDLL